MLPVESAARTHRGYGRVRMRMRVRAPVRHEPLPGPGGSLAGFLFDQQTRSLAAPASKKKADPRDLRIG